MKIYSETADSPLNHRYYCKENTARCSVGRCRDIYGKELNCNKAQFKRRTLHVPNLMQMSENNRFCSFALDSAHVKFDV